MTLLKWQLSSLFNNKKPGTFVPGFFIIVLLPLFYGINGVMYAGMTADFVAAMLALYMGWHEECHMRSLLRGREGVRKQPGLSKC